MGKENRRVKGVLNIDALHFDWHGQNAKQNEKGRAISDPALDCIELTLIVKATCGCHKSIFSFMLIMQM